MSEAYSDPYAVLGLPHLATADEIRQAYFNQVRLHPPEREPDQFKRIRAAYDQLRTSEKRIEADMRLIQDWPQPVRTVAPSDIDITIHPQDVLTLLKACTHLANLKIDQDFREVRL